MYDVGIIGSGPAGYTLALQLAKKGLKVILFEKNKIGGVCLNSGCIPTKSIMKSSSLFKSALNFNTFGISFDNITFDYSKIISRKNKIINYLNKSLEKLILSQHITIIYDQASIIIENIPNKDPILKIRTLNQDNIYTCKNIVIATGTSSNDDSILKVDHNFILNSDDILNLDKLPDNILIVGSGAIGIEWARIFSNFGKKVSIVELQNQLLPSADQDISSRVERILKLNKVTIFKNNSIDYINNKQVYLKSQDILNPNIILSAIGRKIVLPKILDNFNNTLDLELTDNKFIKVNQYFQTNFNNIFAIGDITGKTMLAHSGISQALLLSEFLLNKKQHKSSFTTNIPSVIYGSPEIAWVGKTQQELEKLNIDFNSQLFPISALGKAQTDGALDGFIKIISKDDKILGAHIISPEASSLIMTLTLAIDNNLSIQDLLSSSFPHPTYSEGILETLLRFQNDIY